MLGRRFHQEKALRTFGWTFVSSSRTGAGTPRGGAPGPSPREEGGGRAPAEGEGEATAGRGRGAPPQRGGQEGAEVPRGEEGEERREPRLRQARLRGRGGRG